MKCPECGETMKSRREEAYRYKGAGLPNVMLSGVEVRECPSCGEREVVIPRIEELHRVIAGAIITKRPRLTGDEVRFLRKVLGLSGVDFAARVGVDPATVSRWENGHDAIGPQADRLLRLMVAVTPPKTDYALEDLAEIEDVAKPVRLRVEAQSRGWLAAVA